MRRVIYLALLVFILQSVSQAQSDIWVELNAGVSSVSESNSANSILRYWDGGWKVGGAVSYVVSQDIQLVASVGYSRLRYSGKGPTLAIPDVVGFRMSITGDASHIYEASIGTRLFMSHCFVKPFISIRGGIQYTRVGEIRITTWMEQNPQNTLTTRVYSSSGTSFSKPFAFVGFGVGAPINSSVNVLLEGAFTLTFDGLQPYYLISSIFATLQLNL
ncbi:hypothetical protein JGI14_100127 [Candidatus Kryptonium thompsonii]|uniref:Outer membrane protein beta-barrel domain-containing protein n=2 Tax=Candidatus Kryptonium thompsonii TaxID=1633631 RepID=A0A0P1MK11_9BACT|nr:hypothetical protein [Candidatus Kryptonium thompsoni]CUS76396.1 hypothetical protein JGI12_00012 [Candidatus Kryptonium thompsoni]CUS76620.1 hypothetical protein JGI14_100127 [Candidatus Kryptonium thompsoni]CUS78640.1 hypothetical protein JGI10_00298 [Candidatus Kryptonium thompsoni]CUS83150.1 hypothetical protein JGI6_00897 [Candidatus Kryptonium thompsoni]CUS84531.1 hypothetical protein JGI13_01068 [Candidatus Kryptonium thompsoni]